MTSTNPHYENCKTAWDRLCFLVREKGETYTDQSERDCKELRNESIVITDSSDAQDLTKALRRSLPWVYPNSEELRSVLFSTDSAIHEYSYAERLFGKEGQIDNFIIPLLQKHPQTRRAVIVLYDPAKQTISTSDSIEKPVPVIVCIQFRLSDSLHLSAYIRSCDCFIGLPANLYQLQCLQSEVAKRLGVTSGELAVTFGSLHWLKRYDAVREEVEAGVKKNWKLGNVFNTLKQKKAL